MAKNNDALVFDGVVIHDCKGNFKVEVKTNEGFAIINATPAGKLRQNGIQVINKDRVTVECSPYDPSRGRIIRRLG